MAKAKKTEKYERTVSKEVFEIWTKRSRIGDVQELMALTHRSEPTIIRALKYGYVVRLDLAEAITNFLLKRAEKEAAKEKTNLQKHNSLPIKQV